MNTKLLNRIADKIEVHPERYDQARTGRIGDTCSTPCCVAGWAVILGGKQLGGMTDSLLGAADVLEIEIKETENLFCTRWPLEWFPQESLDEEGRFNEEEQRLSYAQPRPREAAHILRRIAAGEIEL